MQWSGSQNRQGFSPGITTGVGATLFPSSGPAFRITQWGQALMQSSQLVQVVRNSASGSAPGGRTQAASGAEIAGFVLSWNAFPASTAPSARPTTISPAWRANTEKKFLREHGVSKSILHRRNAHLHRLHEQPETEDTKRDHRSQHWKLGLKSKL